MICFGIWTSVLLTATALLNACSTDRPQQNASGRAEAGSDLAATDLPAGIAFMQPQTTYTDLAELRHYSAYNAFRALSNTSSGSSGNTEETSTVTKEQSCFGKQ